MNLLKTVYNVLMVACYASTAYYISLAVYAKYSGLTYALLQTNVGLWAFLAIVNMLED